MSTTKIVKIEDLGYTDDYVYDIGVQDNHNFVLADNGTLVHNCHTAAAPNFSYVVSQIRAAFFFGLSGTPDRKDQRHVIVRNLLGDTIYHAKVERLRPTVKTVKTGYTTVEKRNINWVSMVTRLENDKNRLKVIAKEAIKDAEAGHMVLIPFVRVKAINSLVALINKLSDRKLAYPFYGGLKKDVRVDTLQKARKYKIKILVGNAKLLSTGTNIPRASMLYEVTPSANIPNAEQRFSRVLTPWDDKPPPCIKFFLDDSNVRRNCMRTEYYNCLKPIFRPVVSETQEAIMRNYLNQKDTHGHIEI